MTWSIIFKKITKLVNLSLTITNYHYINWRALLKFRWTIKSSLWWYLGNLENWSKTLSSLHCMHVSKTGQLHVKRGSLYKSVEFGPSECPTKAAHRKAVWCYPITSLKKETAERSWYMHNHGNWKHWVSNGWHLNENDNFVSLQVIWSVVQYYCLCVLCILPSKQVQRGKRKKKKWIGKNIFEYLQQYSSKQIIDTRYVKCVPYIE